MKSSVPRPEAYELERNKLQNKANSQKSILIQGRLVGGNRFKYNKMFFFILHRLFLELKTITLILLLFY